jgi:hypothetical protein
MTISSHPLSAGRQQLKSADRVSPLNVRKEPAMSDEFEPIRLEGPKVGQIHEIATVTAALGFLYSLWPRATGEKRAAAEQACRQALAGDITPEEARKVFYHAALEAGILEQGKG